MSKRPRRDETRLARHWDLLVLALALLIIFAGLDTIIVLVYLVAAGAWFVAIRYLNLIERIRGRRHRAGLCPGCGYNMRGVPGDRCPECNYWNPVYGKSSGGHRPGTSYAEETP